MKVHHITQNITRTNVDAARHFYHYGLGLTEIPSSLDPEGKRLIWFRLGAQELHLAIQDRAEPDSSRHLALVTDDLEACLERLKKCQASIDTSTTGILWKKRNDGSRSAFCSDPDGNRIELMAQT